MKPARDVTPQEQHAGIPANSTGGRHEGLAQREPLQEVAREGNVIAGRYQLDQPLGRGAMGTVWRARHLLLKTPVAIKFLDPSFVGDSEVEDRFMQEARSAAAIRSTHVVQVLDCGREQGVPFIAMELLLGENLETRLGARGRLTPAELNTVFTEVARGIGRAHALGVVHRDLKPGNIFIAREGDHEVTKLVDFGIAKVSRDALQISQVIGTQNGMLLGTPQYMSPEQIRGKTSVDHRTDLWALAIIACECLTGQLPFSGRTLCDLTVQICTEKPLAPSLLGPVPRGFDEWFFKATHKRRSQRFASAAEMAEALTAILLGSSSDARRTRGIDLGAARVAQTHVRTLVMGLWTACTRGLQGAMGKGRLGWQIAVEHCQALARKAHERAPAALLENLRARRKQLLLATLLAVCSGFVVSQLPGRAAAVNDIANDAANDATQPQNVPLWRASIPRSAVLPVAGGDVPATAPATDPKQAESDSLTPAERRASSPAGESAGARPGKRAEAPATRRQAPREGEPAAPVKAEPDRVAEIARQIMEGKVPAGGKDDDESKPEGPAASPKRR